MKFLKWLTICLVCLIILVLVVLRFFPDFLVSASNTYYRATGPQIQTENLRVRYWPLQILAARVSVLENTQVPVLEVTNLDTGIQAWNAWKNGEAYWWLNAGEVEITESKRSADANQAEDTGSRILLGDLLSFSELKINRLKYGDQKLKLHLQQTEGEISIAISHSAAQLKGTLTRSSRGYVLNAEIETLDVASFVEPSAAPTPALADTGLPDLSFLDRWRFSASLDTASETGLALQVVVSGLVQVPVLAPFQLQVDLSVESLRNTNVLGFEFNTLLPLRLSTVIAATPGSLELGELEFFYLDSDVAGTLRFDLSQGIGVIGQLQASRLQLPNPSKQAVEEQEKVVDEQPLFAHDVIDWSWLETVNVELDLRADRFDIAAAAFENFEVTIRAANGNLVVSPVRGQLGEGGFEGALELSLLNSGVKVKSYFNLHDVELESFGVVPSEELIGGATNIVLSLEGSGSSPAEIVAHLSGDILMTVQGATVKNDTFELFGSDVFMETLHKLNPFSKSDPTTELECALIHFEVDNGVLNSNRQLVIETTKMEIVGNGSIDLNDESINIGISPSSREGIGVNVGSLVKFMKLGGTLRNPAPETDAIGVLQSGAAIGAAVSTGGVSILAEGIIKRISNAGSACERALNNDSDDVEDESAGEG